MFSYPCHCFLSIRRLKENPLHSGFAQMSTLVFVSLWGCSLCHCEIRDKARRKTMASVSVPIRLMRPSSVVPTVWERSSILCAAGRPTGWRPSSLPSSQAPFLPRAPKPPGDLSSCATRTTGVSSRLRPGGASLGATSRRGTWVSGQGDPASARHEQGAWVQIRARASDHPLSSSQVPSS